MWPRSARVERPFPTLSIPWVWSLSTWLASWLCVVQQSFYFSLRKAVTSQLPPLVVTLWLSLSFFQDFVSFIMWCIQLTTFIVRYQSCMCVFPFTFCPQHHDFVWNHSPLFSSCVSQLASLTFLLITRYTRATCSHLFSIATLPTHARVWFWARFLVVMSLIWECFSLQPQWRDSI